MYIRGILKPQNTFSAALAIVLLCAASRTAAQHPTECTPLDCNDGNACTNDECFLKGGIIYCTYTAIPNCCRSAADCDPNPCQTATCTSHHCVYSGDPTCCTSASMCNDFDGATADLCIFGHCRYLTVVGTCETNCNDNIECSTDQCFDSVCSHGFPNDCGCYTAADCDDGDQCTTETCSSDGYCSRTGVTPCCTSDAECTPADPSICNQYRCVAGTCVTSNKCADGNDCTTDICGPDGTCIYVRYSCDDDDLCTYDGCIGGRCYHQQKSCTDGDECTANLCNPSTGTCFFPPLVCDDGDACTVDVCDPVNRCENVGPPVSCDDNNLCTVDSCDSDIGCIHDQISCSDGNPCTIDVCTPSTGECAHFTMVCNDNNPCTTDACNMLTGSCMYTPIGCSDNNPCTNDTCNVATGLCAHAPACNDNDACTTDVCTKTNWNGTTYLGHTCANTQLVGCCHTTAECPVDGPCNVATCSRNVCIQTTIPECCTYTGDPLCDDGDSCTVDSCNTTTKMCSHTDVGASCCSDVHDCGHVSPCLDIQCVAGKCIYVVTPPCCMTAMDCNDNDICTNDTCTVFKRCRYTAIPYCPPPTCNDLGVCTTDQWDPLTHTCVYTRIDGCCDQQYFCDTENATMCTTVSCVNASCVTEHIPECCVADDQCADADVCTYDHCNFEFFMCSHHLEPSCCNYPAECDDGNTCTQDDCMAHSCTHTYVEGCCTDDSHCLAYATDSCTLGICVNGTCVIAHLSCNDGDACTIDACDPAFGCIYGPKCNSETPCITASCVLPEGTCSYVDMCEDGDLCTIDACVTDETGPGSANCTHEPVVCDGDNGMNDPCAVGTCVEGICIYTSPCPESDICADWTCVATGNTTYTCVSTPTDFCNDDDLCTTDICSATFGCLHPQKCTSSDICAIASCDPLNGVCLSTPLTCDDDDVCTSDACVSGIGCINVPSLSCDDDLACTNDTCDPILGCVHITKTCMFCDETGCDLGDPCVPYVCTEPLGICEYVPIDCDDDNICTNDTCVGGVCENIAACNDNSDCTTDTCDGNTGDCYHTYSCPESVDKCWRAICVSASLFGGGGGGGSGSVEWVCGYEHINCTDGDFCTTDGCDSIIGCTHEAIPCDDTNDCTADSCNPASGCLHDPISCDDGDACTNDWCEQTGGGCKHSTISCADTDPCTQDLCNTTTGCQHPPTVCGDPDDACMEWWCTTTSGCIGTPVVCPQPEDPCMVAVCDSTLGCIDTPKTCSDDNVCTYDWCDEWFGCRHRPQYCYDAVGGTCLLSTCLDVGENGCPSGTTSCDDGIPCTADECVIGIGCTHTTTTCDDGDACTADMCAPTTVECTHSTISCDDGVGCTRDGCDTTLGCWHNSTCDDFDLCTVDSCDMTHDVCVFDPVVCNDSNMCTIEACDHTTGICSHVGDLECGDGNACTIDSCDPSTGCVYESLMSCNDSNACTVDTCDIVHGCSNVPITCYDGTVCTIDSCDPARGCQFTPISCDDGDACTTDSCNPIYGCTHLRRSCDDGRLCTTDICTSDGGCRHVGVSCDDGDACTIDPKCHPTRGCQGRRPLLDCTRKDKCYSYSCDPDIGCVSTPVNCSDSDRCTVDTCSPKSGCIHAAMKCNDNNRCTSEFCDPNNGQCVYRPIDCDDNNPCTLDSCKPVVGCTHTPACNTQTSTCVEIDDDSYTCVPKTCTRNDPTCGGSPRHYCCEGKCVVKTSNTDNKHCCVHTDCAINSTASPSSVCCAGKCHSGTCCPATLTGENTCNGNACINHRCAACTIDSDCSVGRRCTGIGKCVPSSCNANSDCLDGDACTRDTCDYTTRRCVHSTYQWGCTCHNSSQCAALMQHTTCQCAFCDRGMCRVVHACEDTNVLTRDTCSSDWTTCVHTPTTGAVLPSTWYAVVQLLVTRWIKDMGVFYDIWAKSTMDTLGPVAIVDGLPVTSTPLQCPLFMEYMDDFLYPPTDGSSRSVRNGNTKAIGVRHDDDHDEDHVHETYGPCADYNPCTRDEYDEASQQCIHYPIDCDDGNACTIDRCTDDGRCTHEHASCGMIPEETGTCVGFECFPLDGLCYHHINPECTCNDDACKIFQCDDVGHCTTTNLTCNDGNRCTTDSCVSPIGSCLNVPIDCDDHNPGTYDACDAETGACFHAASERCRACDACHATREVGGRCITTELDCDDNNACTVDTCDDEFGCKHHESLCEAESKCVSAVCDPRSGSCVKLSKHCDDGNACTVDGCDEATGECIHEAMECDDEDDCTVDMCNPYTSQCATIPRLCNDGDACTVDACVAGIGCVHTPFVPIVIGECGVVYCDHTTGDVQSHNMTCDDDNPCTVDECVHDICIHRYPRYHDDSHCVDERQCERRSQQCMIPSCVVDATFGYHEHEDDNVRWDPAPLGTQCTPEDNDHHHDHDRDHHEERKDDTRRRHDDHDHDHNKKCYTSTCDGDGHCSVRTPIECSDSSSVGVRPVFVFLSAAAVVAIIISLR
jgi:hypothetical protein